MNLPELQIEWSMLSTGLWNEAIGIQALALQARCWVGGGHAMGVNT